MYGKSNMELICKIDRHQEFGNLQYGSGNSNGLCINLEGWGREMGERFKRKRIYVYLWLIHVEV